MKKFILFSLSILISICLFSQQEGSPCTPDATLQDSVYLIVPDCIIGDNLPQAYSNQNYNAVIQIKTPEFVGDVIDSAFVDLGLPTGPVDVSGVSVDSITIVSVTGLPTGLSYDCSHSGCTFPGNVVGCVAVSGITSDLGLHDLNIAINGYISFFGTVYDLYGTLGDYQYIDCFTIDVSATANLDLYESVSCNYPNPFEDKTFIEYTSMENSKNTLYIYDITGKLIFSKVIYSNSGKNSFEFNGQFLDPGVYYYSLDNNFQNKIMIKK